jgi:predicted alpha/beta-hydrolase family hydrolase
MTTSFLTDGPEAAKATVLLAHGAGAPMDSAAMSNSAQALAQAGLRVVRFEFAYMAARRTSAARRPPPRAETLKAEYLAAIDALGAAAPLVIGGKSMGGRVASMIADELHAAGRIAGLLCLGYPFHPVGRPDELRTAHLAGMKTPALIVQGARDPFGTREEVSAYALSPKIEIVWVEDGDHALRARKSVAGLSAAEQFRIVGDRVAAWIAKTAA